VAVRPFLLGAVNISAICLSSSQEEDGRVRDDGEPVDAYLMVNVAVLELPWLLESPE
jgi:hypothetical protein